MQILGIYIEHADDNLRKILRNKTWYNFYNIENLHNLFFSNKIESIKKQIINQQIFEKKFYDYNGKQLSLSSVVGKNGSGKTSLLDIYNIIINNFAARIKEVYKYNEGFTIQPINGLKAELYYEIEGKIYCIKIENEKTFFFNEDDINKDLFLSIKSLEELSQHCFYTILLNYSLYSNIDNWKDKLYHKNDGYYTPVVLIPFRDEGNIELLREKLIADKRVQTAALLVYKSNLKDFIEGYFPYKITYKFINEPVSDMSGITSEGPYRRKKYLKLKEFYEYHENTIYIKKKCFELKIDSEDLFDRIESKVGTYWKDFFEKKYNTFQFKEECLIYLKYKTIKSIINYEIMFNELDFSNLEGSICSIIQNKLWNEKKLNYINLKIIMCKRFMDYSYENIYKSHKNDEILIKDFISNQYIKNANTYDELFINYLPDFFETHFFYENNNDKKIVELCDMSSGEQHLYNTLSYIIYHIKNAQSNKNNETEARIPYKYFNVFFDEAELYYHPDYQRTFINNIVKILNRTNLQIEGLNITLITHSPFILSDIPRNCILALDNGNVSDQLNETLGANIYDLLANQFFMKKTIGESSRILIEEIIQKCQDNSDITNDYDFYEEFIKKIGDDYLRPVLLDMLYAKNGDSFIDRRIKEYEEKKEYLQKLKKKNEEN